MAYLQINKRVSIFISYSYKDEALVQELVKQLIFLDRLGLADLWYSRQIEPGENFSTAIHTHLNTAQVILLLISPDFIASRYCYEIETGRALERYKAGEAHIIPVILRSTNWTKLPIGKLQALPTDGKPVMTWTLVDDALSNVAQGVFKIITAIRTEKIPNRAMQSSPQTKIFPDLEPAEAIGNNAPLDYTRIYIQQGQKLFHAGNYEQALHAYEAAKQTSPSSSSIYQAIGECLMLLDRPDEAFMMYKQAANLEAIVYYNKGNMLCTLGDYDTALEAYDIAISLAPSVAETYLRKGDLYRQLGRLEEAQDAYEQAQELMDD